jgi:hypothetical protein
MYQFKMAGISLQTENADYGHYLERFDWKLDEYNSFYHIEKGRRVYEEETLSNFLSLRGSLDR